MTLISDTRNLPPLQIHYIQQFAIPHHFLGDIVLNLRNKVARGAAQKIMEQDRFFKLDIDNGYGTLHTDCIVMSRQEYTDALKDKFEQGVRHGMGFRTNPSVSMSECDDGSY